MRKNFQINMSSVEVVKDGVYYDLHNCYDFVEARLLTMQSRLELRFNPIAEFTQSKSLASLKFLSIDFLQVNLNFISTPLTGLDEIGYKNPTDFDHEWLMLEEQAELEDHMFLRLIGGAFIRVHAEAAEFST